MARSTLSVSARGIGEIEDWLKNMPDETFQQAKRVFARAMFNAQSDVNDNINDRTGNLARSIQTEVIGTDIDSLRVSLYSAASVDGAAVIYGPIHEFGGTIRPVNNRYAWVPGGPYLNIPEDANLNPSQTMRMSATQVFASGEASVDIKPGGGWGVYMGAALMFSLIKKAEIPATLGMRKAVEDQIPTVLSELQNLIGEEE